MGRRPAFALILAAVLVIGLVASPAAVAPARAAEASVVLAAVQVLTDRHISIPDPVKLLAAAVGGLRQALTQTGVTERLPDLDAADAPSARTQFQARFDQAAALAGGRLTETDLQYAAARAMAASLGDSHTSFLTPAEWAERQRSLQNEASFTGIGVRTVVRSGRFYVVEVFPDTPAAAAGLRALDRLVAIDGQSVEGLTSSDIASRIRGPQGTPVSVTVQRQGQSSPLVIAIIRAPISPPAVSFRLLDESIGYLRFLTFSLGSAAQFQRAVQTLQAQGMRGLVLDMRGNSGGFVVELVRIASVLLSPGLRIAVREDRQQVAQVDITAGGPTLNPTTVLTVLIDVGTASSGEILAAAVQEHGRGSVVGVRSAGAVLNSLDFALPGGAALVVAVRRFTTGRGVVLEGVGVAPDVEVDLTAEDLDRGIDAQLQRAVQLTIQRRTSLRGVYRHSPEHRRAESKRPRTRFLTPAAVYCTLHLIA